MPAEDIDELLAATLSDESQESHVRLLDGDQVVELPLTADVSILANALADLVVADLRLYPRLTVIK